MRELYLLIFKKFFVNILYLAEASTMYPTSLASNETKKSASNEKKETNFTLLTLLYCLNILVGNFIDSFSMIANLFAVDIYVKYGFINISGNMLFFASHGVPFFLYFYFNNVFRKRFREIFRFRL